MGIFLVFPLVAFGWRSMLAGRARTTRATARTDFERTALVVGGPAAAVRGLSRGGAGATARTPRCCSASCCCRRRAARDRARPAGRTAARRRRARDAARAGDLAGDLVRDGRARWIAVGVCRRSSSAFYLVAPPSRAGSRRPFDGVGRAARLCRAAAAVRLPGARGASSRRSREPWRAVRRAARARRRCRLARHGDGAPGAVLRRRVLRGRRRGGVVGDSPDAERLRHGGRALRRLRRSSRSACRCSRAARPAAASRRGAAARCCSEPGPAAVPLARAGRAGRAVGAGAAARDHERRRCSSRAPPGGCR